MEHKKECLNIKTIDMVQVALMAAIVYIATAVINIPSYMGVIHLGDSMIFLSAIIFGKKKAAISSAIGMSLFDLLSPYAIWAPFTFVIKGMMAYIAGLLAYRKKYNGNNFWNNVLAFVLAGIWMIAAYYFGGVIISHYYFNMSFEKSFILALNDIFGNVLQVVAGMILALPLAKLLKKGLNLN